MKVNGNPEGTLPEFAFDEINGIIDISGRSISMEVDHYFKEIMEYLENFFQFNAIDVTININLEYFNTKTSRILLNIFELVRKSTTVNDCSLTVNWYYDDEEKEAGEDYSNILDIPFNFIQN